MNSLIIPLVILEKVYVILKVGMVKERLEELSETRVQVLQVFQTDSNRQQTTERQKDRQTINNVDGLPN